MTLDLNLKTREVHREKNKLLYMELWKPEARKPGELRLTQMQTQMMLCAHSKDSLVLPHRMVIRGSNKQGKTAGIVMRAICFACGEQPFLPDGHPLKDLTKFIPIPNQILVMGESLTQSVKHKLIPEFKFWIPKDCDYRTYKNPQGIETEIIINRNWKGQPCGSKLFFRSYEVQGKKYEGIDSHVNLFDEPPPREIYTPAQRGLVATEGYSMIAMTHLNEPWLRPLEKKSVDLGGSDGDFRVIRTGDIWQNHVDNGGFLTTSAIDRFIDEIKQTEPHNYGPRILGDSMMAGHVIFSTFKDEEPYVVPDFEIPENFIWIEGMDPHDNKDTIWVTFAISPYDIIINNYSANRCFLVDYERFPPRDTVEDIVAGIKKRRKELGYDDTYSLVLDSKYGRRIHKTETIQEHQTWEEMLENQGIGYIELADQKPGDVEVGQKIVREYLVPQSSRLDGKDVPGIVVLNRCRSRGQGPGPIEGLENYRQKRTSIEPEDDEYKDMVDPIRYVLSKIPTYVDRSRLKRKREGGGKVVSKYGGR